ncbi:MAG: 2Fe-2S iron-sulfur cluster binding domain, partial [Actinomycetota bacterium]
MSRVVYDGAPIEFQEGDSIAIAALRAGQHPSHGGTLCLAGDCNSCVAIVDGTPWTRTCQTPARPGVMVQRHPNGSHPSPALSEHHAAVTVRHLAADHVVV